MVVAGDHGRAQLIYVLIGFYCFGAERPHR